MIVVDTSAVVAIFRQEDDAQLYAEEIGRDEQPFMSAANVVEASIVLRSLKRITPQAAEQWLDAFIQAAGMRIEPVTAEQADFARAAHARYGRGTGHAAALNYGDCFAYALAKAMQAPLLFKGDDFAQTDIVAALV